MRQMSVKIIKTQVKQYFKTQDIVGLETLVFSCTIGLTIRPDGKSRKNGKRRSEKERKLKTIPIDS